jgi:sulfite exporter TauE/SafE/copper chaperone CopZ
MTAGRVVIERRAVSIVGMHCKACEKMVADEIRELSGVRNVKVSLRQATATITADAGELPDIDDIASAVERAGYKIGSENRPFISREPRDYKLFLLGVVISVAVIFIFAKLGLDPSQLAGGDANGSITLPLVMGLTAGISTCMALVGGLVVGVAAKHEKNYPDATRLQNFAPHLTFNLGRVLGFTVLGGVMGLIGSALTFSPTVLGLLTIAAGLFMLVIGLQLTGLFPRLTSLGLPPKLAEKLGIDRHKTRDYSHVGTFVLGILTFFLPCGFTQAMQLYAVSTGSFLDGALIMGLFALGTTPGLLLVGGLTSLIHGRKAKTILKIVGVFVAALALISVSSGLTQAGFRLPEFKASSPVQTVMDTERLELTYLGDNGFDKKELRVKAGQTYTISILAKVSGVGCMSTVMLPSLSDNPPQLLVKGKVVTINFRADRAGEYELTCAMGVPFNTKIIVEES